MSDWRDHKNTMASYNRHGDSCRLQRGDLPLPETRVRERKNNMMGDAEVFEAVKLAMDHAKQFDWPKPPKDADDDDSYAAWIAAYYGEGLEDASHAQIVWAVRCCRTDEALGDMAPPPISPITIIVSVLLGLSVLFNVVLVARWWAR